MLPDSVLASVLTVAIQGLNAPYGAPYFLTVVSNGGDQDNILTMS